MTRSLILTFAALGLLAGCEADDSLPTRPRASLLIPDSHEQMNAEQRSLEAPARELPTRKPDLPGQSAARVSQPVLTLDAAAGTPETGSSQQHWLGYTGPSGWQAVGHTQGPQPTYTKDKYPGLIPHVPPNPGTEPMAGTTPIPGGEWSVDHSWGQNVTLTEMPHRDWPTTTAVYQTANVSHNPLFYFNVQEQLPTKQNNGTVRSDVKTALIEIPWFYVNTALLPVLLVLEPARSHRVTPVPTPDPNFNGHLPEGPTVAAPYPGVLKWEYPFLNPDGTVKQAGSRTTAPAGTRP